MKTYKSSDLTHKRSEVLREAELNGVIIQQCRTNGEVISELVLVGKGEYMGINGYESSADIESRALNSYKSNEAKDLA